jgi:1,4-alpha-glucan branching enzyme
MIFQSLRRQGIDVHHFNNTDKVIAFHRWKNGGPGDDVVIVGSGSV